MRSKINMIKQEAESLLGKEVSVKGWVRSVRKQKAFAFVSVNDGSCLSGIQVLLEPKLDHYEEIVDSLSTGASVSILGTLSESPGKNQDVEIHAQKVFVLGLCDAEEYPLQKKRHSFEFLRSIAHLRPRTNTLGAVTRVRNALSFATHKFFQEKGFLYIHTPIVTASDCEGAGEMLRVTQLNMENPPKKEDGTVDYEQDFFGMPTYLTVSGQLNAEIYASALSDVYTFGPTFRGDNSNTFRHLAEFWMIEPEMAFADLKDDMDCAEAYLKYVFRYVLDNCKEDLAFFEKFISKSLIERLEQVVSVDFERASYTYAVRILEKSGKKFTYPVKWGADLKSEHERYLAEEYFNKPVILYDYPKEIKPFYMRANDDNKTVAAMDVLFPRIGEIVGGSQREERLPVLEERMAEANLPKENYWWYLELRKYGSVPHAGFGAGFERLVLFATGVENIRDAIPFPRYPGKADF